MLPIRRTCHFLLNKQKGWKALQVRYRIRYGGGSGYITSVYVATASSQINGVPSRSGA